MDLASTFISSFLKQFKFWLPKNLPACDKHVFSACVRGKEAGKIEVPVCIKIKRSVLQNA